MSSPVRPTVPALDAILGHSFAVLDGGFVRAVDYMGSDAAIVQAARVSYGEGTKRVSEDRTLIRYLLRHRHTTPFEMCELKLHVRVPMDTWRQWIRHRTANVNEYSTRYSVAIDAASQTDPREWRLQDGGNRQGSAGMLPDEVGARLSEREAEFLAAARALYQQRLDAGVAREQARKDLPLSTYTEAYWKIDLHNLLHFVALRADDHAQLEIRTYADTIATQIVRRWVPHTWEAFSDYRLGALSLTRLEADVVARLTAGDSAAALQVADQAGWLRRAETGGLLRNRERTEAESKLRRLGHQPPWAPEDAEEG